MKVRFGDWRVTTLIALTVCNQHRLQPYNPHTAQLMKQWRRGCIEFVYDAVLICNMFLCMHIWYMMVQRVHIRLCNFIHVYQYA